MTKKFNKSALLAALKPKTERVDVAGYGNIGIVQLTVSEADSLRANLKKENKIDQFGLQMVLISVVDEDGNRVFDESDLPSLQGASNAAVDDLVAKTLEVNGFKKATETKN